MRFLFYFLSISLLCVLFFAISSLLLLPAEPVILRHADELIGESNEITNTRTLLGNVQLQQKNVYVTCNSAIQYLNTNKFLLSGNVIIKQETLTLQSQSVLYDGNSYLATADNTVTITDRSNKLVGKRGNYSTSAMIANFYDEVILEDDSVKIFADFITYNRKTADSKAIGDVTVKSKNKNIFIQADTIDNFPSSKKTIACGNPVLFQIDTIEQKTEKINNQTVNDTSQFATVDSNDLLLTDLEQTQNLDLDTLSVSSDSMIAFRAENERYIFIGNVEFVKKELKAVAARAIYHVSDEQIILHCDSAKTVTQKVDTVKKNIDTVSQNAAKTNGQTIIWLDSVQLHSDSVVVKSENKKLKNIHSFKNCIAISQSDSANLSRIDQLAGNEIILHIENDSLRKIESFGNAKSVFFSKNDEEEADGVIEATAEKIIIEIEAGQAENIHLIKQVPGKYHPEPLVFGQEKNFYLQEFKKSDNSPARPAIKQSPN